VADLTIFEKINQTNYNITLTRRKIQAIKNRPLGVMRYGKKIKRLQAIEEAQRDVLNTFVTEALSSAKVVDENNYRTYASQVQAAHQMYDANTKYGAEFFGGILDTRVAFIMGEGINVTADKKATEKYIRKFLKENKLNGSQLFRYGEVGELEGKVLTLLKPNRKKEYVSTSIFSWYDNRYSVQRIGDNRFIVTYIDKVTGKTHTINKNFNYAIIGGTYRRVEETPSRTLKVITQIENASRGMYDLQKNSHVFGKITPTWETQDQMAADAINKDVEAAAWEIGQGYAGTAKFHYAEPSGGAAKQLVDTILSNLRAVSASTGIPIHWLAWPDLMSNRATAENMAEMIQAATRKERLIYQETFTEIIEMSMDMAIDAGFENNNIKGDFEINIPFISMAMIKALGEIFLSLEAAGVISMATMRNKTPGIDPLYEKDQIQKEKEENIENNPLLNNDTVNNMLGGAGENPENENG
jgi:hypothetical protein